MNGQEQESIFSFEGKIDTLLRHHWQKFEYRGEPGEEYRLIASILNQLNQVHRLENKHILWYTAINQLVFKFRSYRHRHTSREISLITSGMVRQKITGTRRAENPHIMPGYIDNLEVFIDGTSRFGILLSSNPGKNRFITDYYFEKITGFLVRLLTALRGHESNESSDTAYLLTMENATENILFQTRGTADGKRKALEQQKNSAGYRRLISEKLESRIGEFTGHFYQTDNFWNGLIP